MSPVNGCLILAAPDLSVSFAGLDADRAARLSARLDAPLAVGADVPDRPEVVLASLAENIPSEESWLEHRRDGGVLRMAPDGGQVIVDEQSADGDSVDELWLVALVLALAKHKVWSIHGALIRVFDTSMLVLAPPGAGKSTLACAAIAAGGVVVSDDSLLLDGRSAENVMYSLRRDLYLRELHSGLFPAEPLQRTISGRAGTRVVVDRTSQPGWFLASAMPERVWIIEPHHASPRTRFERPSRARLYAEIVRAGSPVLYTQGAETLSGSLAAATRRLVDLDDPLEVHLGRDLLADPCGFFSRAMSV